MLKIGDFVQTFKSLVETKVELIKRDIQDQFLGILTRLILLVLMGGCLLLVLLFMSFSLAFYLSQYFESPFMGFFLVGLIYLLILLVLYITRESMKTQDQIQLRLRKFILKTKIFKKNDE